MNICSKHLIYLTIFSTFEEERDFLFDLRKLFEGGVARVYLENSIDKGKSITHTYNIYTDLEPMDVRPLITQYMLSHDLSFKLEVF